jgi:uncharacterized membrane protein
MRRNALRYHWQRRKLHGKKRAKPSGLASVVDENIQLIDEYRAQVEKEKTFQDHLADWITRWSGSMWFVYMHIAWFGVWIAANVGAFGIPPFDPFPFGLLTTIVSLEAIFLSTFVLVSQNRQAAIGDRKSELDLQIDLLAEYEMTRVLKLIKAIAEHLDLPECKSEDLKELLEDVKPDEVLKEIEAHANGDERAKAAAKRKSKTRD